jgi:hypothetical protein
MPRSPLLGVALEGTVRLSYIHVLIRRGRRGTHILMEREAKGGI